MRGTMTTSIPDTLYALEPIVWFLATIPLFNYSVRQPLGSRWISLACHTLFPIQCYRKAGRLALFMPECVWFVALTALCAAVHHTSAIGIECWTLSELRKTCSGRSDTTIIIKAWMNPRRAFLQRGSGRRASLAQRAIFCGRKLLEAAALAILCVIVEGLITGGLRPHSVDFTIQHRGYLHWKIDRQALLRLCFAFHWAWLTIFFLHLLHSILAILFVAILPIDNPDDWPALFGNPLQAYSLRRFWGIFWHKIAAPSQAVYGRLITRRLLGLSRNTSTEKTFVALWVFTFSGIVHIFANVKADAAVDSSLDLRFLLLNFCGGMVESLVVRSIPTSIRHQIPTIVKQVFGFTWVWLFFYCTVPAYQWPVYHNEATRRESV